MTGSGTKACSVYLTDAATTKVVVTLSSDNPAVKVPSSVTIGVGASHTGFTTTVASVSSPQTANIVGNTGGVSRVFVLQLNPAIATLSINPGSIAFGNVAVSTATSQPLTLTSTGTMPVTINAAALTGTGFTMSGAAFPLTLNSGSAVTLNLQFNPTTSGTTTGHLTVTSNSSGSPTSVIGLSGTGMAVVSALSCSSTSITGSTTDACSVSLNAPAPNGGQVVTLSSTNAAVTLPAAVTVAPGAATASFAATVSSVGTAQTATLTANANGSSKAFSLQLNAANATLGISPTALSFGNVAVNTPATQSVTITSTGNAPLTISAVALTGESFTISGTTFPVTLNPSQAATLSVQFNPLASGSAAGQLTISTNSSTGSTSVVGLSGTGIPAVSALSCTSASLTGSGTDLCTVTLNAAAPSEGFSTVLSSSSTAVTLPTTVTVASGASSAVFTATAASVTTAQTATLTAVANGVSKCFALQLNAATPTLGTSTSSLDFGILPVNTPASQPVTLTSTGTAPVTISAASLTGSGFIMSGATFPVTLNPSIALTLNVQFNPTTAGTATGQLTLTSNSSVNPALAVSLTGVGLPLVSALSCTNASITGAGTDACTIILTGPAPAGGQIVTLSTNNSAVTLPATITVVEGATNAAFTATASSVSSSQAATLTATANGVTKCFALQLNVTQSLQIFVDSQKGVDGGAGTILAPLKTIQAAVSKANANNQKSLATTIVVNPGIYREYVSISGISKQTSAALTIQAATPGTAIISASDVLSSWAPESANPSLYSSPWQNQFGTCAVPTGWPTNFAPIALRSEMIFVNGIALTQVMLFSDLKAGTFFVDESASTIHVWPPSGTNMQTAVVESAIRPQTLSVSARSNVTISGLVLRHARSCLNQAGATIGSSSNVLVDSVQALWNNWGGLSVSSSSNVTVQNSIASHNGGVGFLGNRDQTLVFDSNESDYNNWRGAQAAFYEWGMGGTKMFQMRTTTVKNHFSYNNQAEGLWFDTDNQNITIDNATLSGNVTAALQIERNVGPVMLKNSHLCSSGVGVNVLTSKNLTIQNNIFYNNGATNKYQAQIYLAGQSGGIQIADWQTGQVNDLFTTGMVLSGNTFVDGATGQLVFGTYLSGSDWSTFASTLNASNNQWYDPITTSAFKIPNGKLVNLGGWQSAVGTDTNATWAPPATSLAAACAAPAPAYIDFNVVTDNRNYTMAAGKVVVTALVSSFGAGAVTLNATGLPVGVTAAISQPTLVSGVAALTLTATKTATAQTVPVTLWAVGSGRVHSVTFNVQIVPGA